MLSQPDGSCVLAIVIVIGVLLVLTADKWNPAATGGTCGMLSHISNLANAAGASAMKGSGMSARLASSGHAESEANATRTKPGGNKYGASITSHVRKGAEAQIEMPLGSKTIGCNNLNTMLRGPATSRRSPGTTQGMWIPIPPGFPIDEAE